MDPDIHARAFQFAVRVCTFRKDVEFRRIARDVVIRQLVASATSIGANLAEARGAQSRPDFVAKVAIARKESREAQFWLRLAHSAKLLEGEDLEPLITEATSIGQVVSAICRTASQSTSRTAPRR